MGAWPWSIDPSEIPYNPHAHESHEFSYTIQKNPGPTKTGTYKGCEALPGTPSWYKERWWHNLTFADPPTNFNGKSCTATITEDHKISVSFIAKKNLPIIYTSKWAKGVFAGHYVHLDDKSMLKADYMNKKLVSVNFIKRKI